MYVSASIYLYLYLYTASHPHVTEAFPIWMSSLLCMAVKALAAAQSRTEMLPHIVHQTQLHHSCGNKTQAVVTYPVCCVFVT